MNRLQGKYRVIDVHCEGEIGKVLIADKLELPGETIAEKLHYINTVDDSLRRTLTLEPRASAAGSMNLLFTPRHPEADAAFIVLQPDQAHAMSGSNSICVVTALLESGMVAMQEPETTVTLETAAGLVVTTARCENNKCKSVSLDMPPAFVESLDTLLSTPDWGDIKIDICFGGVFYAIVDVAQTGLKIEREYAYQLASAGMQIKSLVSKGIEIQHPQIPEIRGVAYVMFRSVDPDGAIRTCTVLSPGRVDRSPCGTGSSAHLATLHARGLIEVGAELISRSIIGSEFRIGLTGITNVEGRKAVLPRITGRAWRYGTHEVFVDPEDPFPGGFALSDTWGVMSGDI